MSQSHLDVIIYSRLCIKRNVTFGGIRCIDLFGFVFRNLRLYLQDSGRGGQDGRRLFRRRLMKEEDDRKKEAELQRRLNEKAEADEENEQGEFLFRSEAFETTGIGMGSHVVLCYLEQNECFIWFLMLLPDFEPPSPTIYFPARLILKRQNTDSLCVRFDGSDVLKTTLTSTSPKKKVDTKKSSRISTFLRTIFRRKYRGRFGNEFNVVLNCGVIKITMFITIELVN